MNTWAIIRDSGVFISVIAAAVGYWFRIRMEQKRTVRRVLYCMLEIRTAAIRQFMDNPETDKAARQLMGISEDAVKNQGHFELKGNMFKLPDEYIRDYETAIYELSKDRPLLAVELRGSEKFHTTMEAVRKAFTEGCSFFLKNTNTTFFESKSMRELAERFGEKIRQEIESLDKLILQVAKASGLSKQTKIILQKRTVENYLCRSFETLLKNVDESKEFKDRVLSELKAAGKPEVKV